MTGSDAATESGGAAPFDAAAGKPDELDVSLRPSRRPILLAILAICIVTGAIYGIVVWRGRPDPIRRLFAEQLPVWQLQREKGWIPAGGPELLAMQATLRSYPEVSAALRRLDSAFPDAEAVKAAGEGLSDALFASHLPYYLDPQPVSRKTILLSYTVVGEAVWRAGSQSTFVRRLSRIDRLNVEMGLFGQTERGRAIVLLDRIESNLVKDLLDAAGKRQEPASTRALTDADHAALYELRRALAAHVGEAALDSLVAALVDREAAFETMRRRLHGGKVEFDTPESFAFGDAWFESLWPLSSLNNPGGPLVLDTDLRALDIADGKLRTRESKATIDRLLDVLALGTEAHETRHALDNETAGQPEDAGARPGHSVPAALAALVGNDPRFAGLADRELRAYLGEIHDAPSPPCFTVVQAIRQVRGRYVPRTPHFYAHLLILGRLGGDEMLADPAALVHRLCAEPAPALRARAATLWKELYGTELLPAQRQRH